MSKLSTNQSPVRVSIAFKSFKLLSITSVFLARIKDMCFKLNDTSVMRSFSVQHALILTV